MTDRYLISIIVPVFNVEKYIERCVKSLRKQTLDCLEIILVDDGSTDNSSMICDWLAEQDDRIKVIHNQNSGVSRARNIGLAAANGVYVGFVDSDDYVDFSMYEKLFNAINETDSDLSCCGVLQKELDGFTRKIYGTNKQYVYTKEDIINDFFDNQQIKDYMYSPCNKLYRRDVIGKLRFHGNLRMGEDFLFVFEYIGKSTRICIHDECLYTYEKRENSAMTSSFSDKRMDYLKSVEIIEDICKRKYPFVLQKALIWGYQHRINTCNQLEYNPDYKKKYFIEYEKLRKYISTEKKIRAALPIKIKAKIVIKDFIRRVTLDRYKRL